MQAPRMVLLNDKCGAVARGGAARRFGSCVEPPFPFVFCERHRPIIRAERPQVGTENRRYTIFSGRLQACPDVHYNGASIYKYVALEV